MRSDTSRMFATIVIWGAFTIIVVAMLAGLFMLRMDIYFSIIALLLVIFLSLLVGVTRSTMAIWSSPPVVEESAKAKRVQSSRVRRLVDSLGDDEIYELEALLLAREDDEKARHGSR